MIVDAREAIVRVLALHKRTDKPVYVGLDDGGPDTDFGCEHCDWWSDFGGDYGQVRWPCETAIACGVAPRD